MKENRWRWLAWSSSVLLLLVIATLWSQLHRIQDGGSLRIAYHVAMWVAMCGAVFAFPSIGRKQSLILLGVMAVLVRLAFWQAPVSDDINRYIWEGQLILKGENPYAHTADHPDWIDHRDQYWHAMNHRDHPTAYPPGMELVMAGSSWIWNDLRVFKVVALLGDLWTFAALALLLIAYKKPIRWLGFYAFNPVVLASFAVEAHLDSLMVGALLSALLMARKGSWKWVFFWLGIAIQMKWMVAILLPYFLVRGDWKKSWVLGLVLIIPSLFFGEDFLQGVAGLLQFGRTGAFNGGIYETLRWVGLSETIARSAGMIAFVAVGLFFGWRTLRGREKDLVSLAYVMLFALLIGSPVVHFWYLCWIIPLFALRPSLSGLVLFLTMAMYFFAWDGLENGGAWGYDRAWVVVTWCPFFFILLWELRFFFKRISRQSATLMKIEVKTIDVVVPIYNAADKLPSFLAGFKRTSPEVGQVIVVDGGSSDSSAEIARSHGCKVIVSKRGRGSQIASGIKESSADLIAIIHADTEPRAGWIPHLISVANNNPQSPAFALGQRFRRASMGLLFVEILNEARAMFGGSVFGDQTLIVRREILEDIGGFPAQPLMEDVEVSWRLLERGNITYLGEEWIVSEQKWNGRFVVRFRQVISLMIRYRWARMKSVTHAAEFSKRLYGEYYPDRK